MKKLPVLVVLAAVTAAVVVFRGSFWRPVEAARQPEQADRALGIGRPALDRKPAPEGASLAVVLAGAGETKDSSGTSRLFASLAAECGNALLEKARKEPDNPHLLAQAAAHYRACLAHEPTTRSSAALFAEVRKKLEQVERLQARRRATPRPAPSPLVEETISAPTVEETQRPQTAAAKKDSGETGQVGPDGVPFRRTVD
jgi:hypothetical protein